MKKVTIGSGLTEHSVVTYTYQEWTELDRIVLNKALTTFPEYLGELRDWATRILTNAVHPAEDKLIRVANNGQWTYASDVSKFEHGGPAKLIRGLDYAQRGEELMSCAPFSRTTSSALARTTRDRPASTRTTSMWRPSTGCMHRLSSWPSCTAGAAASPPPTTGMTEKNRAMLRQFEDDGRIDLLLAQGERALAAFTRLSGPRVPDALTLQSAFAMELLLAAPVRP